MLSDGKAIDGKGMLTNLCIDALQSLYGYVLRSNKGNCEAMAKGVMAILYHYSSTEKDPQYQYSPGGETSWSKFQVDKYNGEQRYRPDKDPIPNAVMEVILPVFEKLGSQKSEIRNLSSYSVGSCT